MTETQGILSETPNMGSPDVLSDLLASMHLSGVVLFRTEFREPWGLLSPNAEQMARLLPFRTEYIIPFHIVAAGGCWVDVKETQRVWLEAGDAVLLPYGDQHGLRGQQAAEKVPAEDLLPAPPWPERLLVAHGGDGGRTDIICGFLQCDELLFHPLLRYLPVLMPVKPGQEPANAWLAATIRHTIEEAGRGDPGRRTMLSRLTELMFVEILRAHMRGLSSDDIGWFAAVNDPVVGQALRWLHAAPLDAWSVDLLARRVGVSRTVLAERFKHFLATPPMQYLSAWRLQLAAQRLKTSTMPIKAVAESAGYETEAAFSRAFKRHFGAAPGDWRKRQGKNSGA